MTVLPFFLLGDRPILGKGLFIMLLASSSFMSCAERFVAVATISRLACFRCDSLGCRPRLRCSPFRLRVCHLALLLTRGSFAPCAGGYIIPIQRLSEVNTSVCLHIIAPYISASPATLLHTFRSGSGSSASFSPHTNSPGLMLRHYNQAGHSVSLISRSDNSVFSNLADTGVMNTLLLQMRHYTAASTKAHRYAMNAAF